jgi:VWFA-related protein
MTPYGRRAILPLLIGALTLTGEARQAPPPPPTQAQQRPVFRGGTHFVRVDAYPVQDGKIAQGLRPDDFEVFEDGKPQTIESFDFVKFDTFVPESERREPNTQREGFDRAADPRFRVFVIVVDTEFAGRTDVYWIQKPLVHFLDRILGSRDLYGFLTTRNSAKDLVLGQKAIAIESQVMDLFRSMNIDVDDEATMIDRCNLGLLGSYFLDKTYTSLEGYVQQLGSIRQERKNIVFVTNGLARPRPDVRQQAKGSGNPEPPRIGITNGRLGEGEHANPYVSSDRYCASEYQRLATMDFDGRYRMLIDEAKRANVSFYTITPAGLQAPATLAGQIAVTRANDDLISLARETDGIAIVNTNDLDGGMRKIADDLAAYYVLGYYTTNTNFDGGIRSIKVRLKANGKAIRARQQYRAPTQAEIAALAANGAPAAGPTGAAAAAPAREGPSPREAALIVLDRASRPFAGYVAAAGKTLTVVAELSAAAIQSGKWNDGADVAVTPVAANGDPMATARARIDPGSFAAAVPVAVGGAWPARVTIRLRGSDGTSVEDWIKVAPPSTTVIGEPIAYRSASRIATRPVAVFEFARNERIRVEWPVLQALDRREVRLLDRTGRPLPVELPLSEDPRRGSIVVDMGVSGLMHGDYLIELTAAAGGAAEKSLIALRVK